MLLDMIVIIAEMCLTLYLKLLPF